MKFAAPRSDSPIKRSARRSSTYRLPSDSEDDASSSDESSASSSSSNLFGYESESKVTKSPAPAKRVARSVSEQYNMEDMVASIRLRVTHRDAYEEWEQQTRKDAFLSARHEQANASSMRRQSLASSQTQTSTSRATLHRRQMEEVRTKLSVFRQQKEKEEIKWRELWKERDRKARERVESVIKTEEDKARAKLEEERKKREEEERARKEAEEEARQEEERRRQEAERQRQEAEARQVQIAQEEEEKRRIQELEKMKAEQEKAEAAERKTLGMTTAAEDWKRAREMLKKLKSGPMRMVKERKESKTIWNAGRRQITPKIGQITNDPQAIARISQQLHGIIRPTPPHPPSIYFALLSSLAKAILLQAETEVTAEKRSAIPLAQVAANLLGSLDNFPDIFYAKLCQRAGGWPVPTVVPATDVDGTAFDSAGHVKALGYRQDEAPSDYATRVTGVMRLYFHIMSAPVNQPLDPRYRLPRFWTYFSRMLSEPHLLQTHIAAEVLSVALDVNGALAMEVWGIQWIKLLGVLYEGCTVGLFGNETHKVGGNSPEGVAARVRVQVEIEKFMAMG